MSIFLFDIASVIDDVFCKVFKEGLDALMILPGRRFSEHLAAITAFLVELFLIRKAFIL